VVTGVDRSGRSVILADGEAPTVMPEGPDYVGYQIVELWKTRTTPPDLSGEDFTAEPFELDPVPGGVNWRVTVWPPVEVRSRIHKTDTVDLVYILSGTVYVGVGDDETSLVETLLSPGDSIVALGNMHSWRNPGPDPCVAVATMVSSIPLSD